MLEVKLITAEETIPLRHKILRPNFTKEECVYPNDKLPLSFHVGGFLNNELVCIASFSQEEFSDFKKFGKFHFRLRGMACDTQLQKSGFGTKVLMFGLSECKNRGSELVWCNARENAFNFYAKNNFTIVGDFFDIPGIGPHKVMWVKV